MTEKRLVQVVDGLKDVLPVKTLIAAALLLATPVAPALAEAVPCWALHLEDKQFEAQLQLLSKQEQLSVRICLGGYDQMRGRQPPVDPEDRSTTIHCDIAAKAIRKHPLKLTKYPYCIQHL